MRESKEKGRWSRGSVSACPYLSQTPTGSWQLGGPGCSEHSAAGQPAAGSAFMRHTGAHDNAVGLSCLVHCSAAGRATTARATRARPLCTRT